MERLIHQLHEGGYACVVEREGITRTFVRGGVADLYDLLTREPEALYGARVVDKVVGKGAAALLILGKVGEVYAEVISLPALALLRAAGVRVSAGQEVAFIRNRAATGMCPVESLCSEVEKAEDMLPLIHEFMMQIRKQV